MLRYAARISLIWSLALGCQAMPSPSTPRSQSAGGPAATASSGAPQSQHAQEAASAEDARPAEPEGRISSDALEVFCGRLVGEDVFLVYPNELTWPGTIMMLGEIHGTAEMPRMALGLACQVTLAGHHVLLGLEIPESEQAAIDRYLASKGTAADRAALLAGPHWTRADQDGRSSQAMLDVIEQVRYLHQREHWAIEIFAFDAAARLPQNERDAYMARNILARAANDPEHIVLTLSGNLHNRTIQGLPGFPDLVPMGVHVEAGSPNVLSIEMRHAGGTAWICQPSQPCGPAELAGKPQYERVTIKMDESTRKQGIDGYFAVGPITASPPAVQSAASP